MAAALSTRPEPALAGVDGIAARAVAATLECVAQHGFAKTTLDDIARAAGCSRATLYRYFDGKQDLVAAAIGSEADRIVGLIGDAARAAATLEDAIVAMLEVADRELSGHPALTFVAAVEPERLLPYLTFAGGDRFLHDAGVALAPCLEQFLGADPRRGAEWLARVGLALWMSPASRASFEAPGALRDYVHDFIVPGLVPMQSDLAVSSSPGPSSSGPSSPNPSRG